MPSRSRPDRGMVKVRSETRNQRGEIVQILLAKLIVPRRAATSPQPQGELAAADSAESARRNITANPGGLAGRAADCCAGSARMSFDFATRLPQRRGAHHRRRSDAGGPDRGAAGALPARADRAARPARRLVRGRARAGVRPHALSARRRAGRGALRPGRGRRRHQRARGRLVLSPRRRAAARILVLDNHDDFGGHAKRNEFTPRRPPLIGYGGSESIDSPGTNYSDVAKALLRELGVDIARFESAFDRTLYASLGLARGVFFPREAFGRDMLVPGEPASGGADERARVLANARPLDEFIAAFPVAPESKAQCCALYDARARSARGPDASRRSATSSSPPATATI